MFGRRVFASAPIPRAMWATLHIQNKAQAARMLPSLAPLASLIGSSTTMAAFPGLAMNALAGASGASGCEDGLVSLDGKLMGAEASSGVFGCWSLSACIMNCQPIISVMSCSPLCKMGERRQCLL